MPKKGAEERIYRYKLKMTPERVKEDFEKSRDRMIAGQARAANELAVIEDRVKGVLAEEDVASIQYIWYYDFARQVYRRQGNLGGGNALGKEATLLIHNWSERGCDEKILRKLLFEVFSIEPK